MSVNKWPVKFDHFQSVLQLDAVRQSTYLTHHYQMHGKIPLFILSQIIYKAGGSPPTHSLLQLKQSRNPMLSFLLHTWTRVSVCKEKSLLLLAILNLFIILPSICRNARGFCFSAFSFSRKNKCWRWSPCLWALWWRSADVSWDAVWTYRKWYREDINYSLVVEHLLSMYMALDSILSTAEIFKNTYIHI